VEKEVVEVKDNERAKEEKTSKEGVKGGFVMEEFAKQAPAEKGGLVWTLKELKKKLLGYLLCMS